MIPIIFFPFCNCGQLLRLKDLVKSQTQSFLQNYVEKAVFQSIQVETFNNLCDLIIIDIMADLWPEFILNTNYLPFVDNLKANNVVYSVAALSKCKEDFSIVSLKNEEFPFSVVTRQSKHIQEFIQNVKENHPKNIVNIPSKSSKTVFFFIICNSSKIFKKIVFYLFLIVWFNRMNEIIVCKVE